MITALNKIIPSFFLVFIFLSIGTVQNFLDYGIYMISILGLFFYLKERSSEPKEKLFSKDLFHFMVISYLLLFYITLRILLKDYKELFSWEYEVFRFLILMPFIALFFKRFSVTPVLVWKSIVISGLYVIPFSIYIWMYHLPRGAGLLDNPILSGNLAMTFALLSLVSFFALKSRYWKFLAILVFVFGVFLSFLSGSRGGWLGLLLGAFTIGIMLYKLKRFKELYFSIAFISALIILVVLADDIFPVKDRIILAYQNITNYFAGHVRTSVGYRLEMWLASYYGFIEKPIWGWGWDEFTTMLQAMAQKGYVELMDFGQPHNDYIRLLIELGLVGLVMFLLFILYPFFKFINYARLALKMKDDEGLMFAVTGIVFLEILFEFMLSDGNITYKHFMIFFMLICILIFLYFGSKYDQNNVQTSSNRGISSK
ncbi:O-antigen ligase family protein [Galenea microaerophila]